MEKIVKTGERVTHVTLDGTECAVKFSADYRAFFIKSEGGEVLVSLKSGAVKGDDGTLICPSGGSVSYPHMRLLDTVYLTGSGDVTVFAGNEAKANPFNVDQGGGEITVSGEAVTMNGLQGGVPFPKIAVKGKNLATVPQNVVLFGNTTSGFRIDESETGKSYIIPIKHNTQYTFSNYKFGDRLRIVLFKEYPTNTLDTNTKSIIFRETEIENYPVVTFNNDNYNYCVITVNRDVANFTPRIQLEIGGSATDYVRPIIGEEFRLTVFRKNLLPELVCWTLRNGVSMTVDKDGYVRASGTSTDAAIISHTNEKDMNFEITDNMILSYFGDVSGATVGASIVRNGERIELVLNENGEELQKGDVLNLLYIQVHEADVEVSVTGRFHLELETTAAAESDSYGNTDYYIIPDSNPYTVPFEIYQRDGLNYVYVHVAGSDKPTLTVTGTKESITLEKIWNKLLDLETAIIVSNGEI